MAGITLQLEGVRQLDRLIAFTDPKLYNKAIKGGLSYAAKAVPPAVAKGISASYSIKSSRIKQDISSVRIEPDGSAASIRFSRRPPTLTQYGARPGTRATGQRGLGRGMGWSKPAKAGRPLTATVLRAQGRKPYPGAFMAGGNFGNRLVFRRGTNQLHSIYGPSVGSIFLGQSAIAQQLQATAETRINEQFKKGFDRVIGAANRGFNN